MTGGKTGGAPHLARGGLTPLPRNILAFPSSARALQAGPLTSQTC